MTFASQLGLKKDTIPTHKRHLAGIGIVLVITVVLNIAILGAAVRQTISGNEPAPSDLIQANSSAVSLVGQMAAASGRPAAEMPTVGRLEATATQVNSHLPLAPQGPELFLLGDPPADGNATDAGRSSERIAVPESTSAAEARSIFPEGMQLGVLLPRKLETASRPASSASLTIADHADRAVAVAPQSEPSTGEPVLAPLSERPAEPVPALPDEARRLIAGAEEECADGVIEPVDDDGDQAETDVKFLDVDESPMALAHSWLTAIVDHWPSLLTTRFPLPEVSQVDGGAVVAPGRHIPVTAGGAASEKDEPPVSASLLITNRFSASPVQFLANGRPQRLEPGESIQLEGSTAVVAYHRGGAFGDEVRELTAGEFFFLVTAKGWQLQEESRAEEQGETPR